MTYLRPISSCNIELKKYFTIDSYQERKLCGSLLFWQNEVNVFHYWYHPENEQRWTDSYNSQSNTQYKILKLLSLKAFDCYFELLDKIVNELPTSTQKATTAFFSTIIEHYIVNASDSLIKALLTKHETYQAELSINLSYTNGNLRVSIEDNGIGIEANIEEHLFNDQITTKKNAPIAQYGGAGYGLLFIKKFQNQLNGKAGFTNKGLNQGAIFWFEANLEKCKIEYYKKHSYSNL